MTQKYHQGRALPHGVAQAYAVSIGRRDGQVLQYLPSERLVHEADGLDTFRGVANAGFVRSAIRLSTGRSRRLSGARAS